MGIAEEIFKKIIDGETADLSEGNRKKIISLDKVDVDYFNAFDSEISKKINEMKKIFKDMSLLKMRRDLYLRELEQKYQMDFPSKLYVTDGVVYEILN